MECSVVVCGTVAAWMQKEWEFSWGWINWFNLIIVLLLLAPNLLYAMRRRNRNLCGIKWMNVTEQTGRYSSMLFMVVCFKNGGFRFSSVFSLLMYGLGTLLLLLAYWSTWLVYFRMTGVPVFVKGSGPAAGREAVWRIEALQWILALLPCGIFLISGLMLSDIPLIVFGLCFTVGHICVTRENIRMARR